MNSLITKNAEGHLKKMDTPTTYVPSIKITYAISPHFAEGKAELGDFYLNEQSLGNEIKATALAYRYQVIALDKGNKSMVDSLILGEGEVPFRETKEYSKFTEKYSDTELQDGVDILLYLPEHKLFGVLFAKKKLLKGGLKILENAGNKAIVKIKTVEKKWERLTWYELEVKLTSEKVNGIDSEKMEAIYNAQIISEEEVKTSKRKR